jgi:hypothetical protein
LSENLPELDFGKFKHHPGSYTHYYCTVLHAKVYIIKPLFFGFLRPFQTIKNRFNGFFHKRNYKEGFPKKRNLPNYSYKAIFGNKRKSNTTNKQ